jgi:outer membrane lipopolysaccharide assembly protein LptE/RlpB
MRTAITLLALSLLLGGCGFRPAGSLGVEHLDGTRIVDVAGNTRVGYDLSRRLALAGIDDTGPDGTALRTLRVLDETFLERPLTITTGARVGEFEISGSATFELLDAAGEVLIPPRTVSAEAVYLLDRTNLLGSREEERLLQDEIREQLVRRILDAVAVVAGGAL